MPGFNLDRVRMTVVRTASSGVVDHRTIFEFTQRDDIVTSEYSGGEVVKGYLVGKLGGASLQFRYCQLDRAGNLDGGLSNCRLSRLADGRLAMVESFQWESREDAGENVFEELARG